MAWVSWADIPAGSPLAHAGPAASAMIGHPVRRRIESTVAAARAELGPASRRITVTVDGMDSAELDHTRAWLAAGQLTAVEAGRRLGIRVDEEELPGWVSGWLISAHGPNGVTTTSVLPTMESAELAVDLASWLQQVLADAGISEPVPPCPGHPHPMVPTVHEAAPWWSCPAGNLVRPWQTHPTAVV
ncbi:hypothetical protein [Frankia sp. Cppng1_Ct_nod]|uniref:hypothetical protein n=1 Tax=Frankia sp. Cppng1_Ct_nod TaxID=2897162 RepID=UPI002024C107|nr:hypothetical protein [Frankia sp. Cppng1_Ct_nod]